MRLPFISRERHDETKAMLEKRIAELESERQKLWDVIAYNACHLTIFNKDLIPQPPAEPIVEDEPDEIEQETQYREQVLASIRKTRPSQLGRTIARMKVSSEFAAAERAHPARPVFAHAREQALKQ